MEKVSHGVTFWGSRKAAKSLSYFIARKRLAIVMRSEPLASDLLFFAAWRLSVNPQRNADANLIKLSGLA